MEVLADPEVVTPGPRLRATGGRVLVLNASFEPINVCTVRRAAVLVLKSRAEMLEAGVGALHSERLELDRPCVIRLVRYVRIPRDVHRRKITRKAVLARDVLLVPSGSLPRTSSGKIARRAGRAAYIDGTLRGGYTQQAFPDADANDVN